MGEKLYRPIIKDGDHLVRSSKNPDRVRGQSRDSDNKNPDIVEWEEVANEIRIMSNAQIRRAGEREIEYVERIEASKKYLTEKVASNIDKLLLDQTQQLDMKTSKELFGLFGGGVVINGEYIPVEHTKVFEAIVAQND